MAKTQRDPVESFTDWLGQEVRVGDDVTVTYRHGDIAAAYSAEVVDIAFVTPDYGSGEVKAQIVPTGRYSYHRHHVWPYEYNHFTGKNETCGRPKPNWVIVRNITKTQVKVLDNGA